MPSHSVQAFAASEQSSPLGPFTFDATPRAHECLIAVTHCGICHSDIHMIDNDWEMSRYPLVPGHEVVGKVLEVGEAVENLRPGQRVGVGWQRSACLHCHDCLRGEENLCEQSLSLIGDGFGGFADHLVVDARFCFTLPDGIASENAGPLLCAGITVYSALRHAGMSSGQRIGIIGVGGLGHLAIRFARALGNRVVAFTTSPDKKEEAHAHGAHEVVLLDAGTLTEPLQQPLDIILSTVPANLEIEPYLNSLNSDGVLSFVGVPSEPLNVPLFPLLTRRRRIMASPIGGRSIMHEMLAIADTYGITPQIERFPLSQVNKAIERVRQNRVRYRAVLEMNQP